MNPLYPDVASRAGDRCEYCHAPQSVSNFWFEVKHIMPIASGGSDADDNLALACRSCNAFKSTRRVGIDPQTQVAVSLFHPRRDIWEDHFTIDAQTLQMIGLTAVGRATISLLQLNSPAQLTARWQWKRLELFP